MHDWLAEHLRCSPSTPANQPYRIPSFAPLHAAPLEARTNNHQQTSCIVSLQVHDWLAEHLHEGARVGIDPFAHTIEAAEKLRRRLRAASMSLVPLEPNPVDAVWGVERPSPADVSGCCCGAVHWGWGWE